MSPGRRHWFRALAVLVLAAGSSAAASAASLPSANVRPFFDVGYSHPVGFGDFDRGFGLGFGFEIEQTAALSALFRVDWSEVEATGTPPRYYVYAPYPYSTVTRRSAISWSVGARLHALAGRAIHPYSELLLGTRMIGDEQHGTELSSGVSVPSHLAEGLAATVRLGASTARPGGAGFFFDMGYEFPVEKPNLYGLVPLRIGVLFP